MPRERHTLLIVLLDTTLQVGRLVARSALKGTIVRKRRMNRLFVRREHIVHKGKMHAQPVHPATIALKDRLLHLSAKEVHLLRWALHFVRHVLQEHTALKEAKLTPFAPVEPTVQKVNLHVPTARLATTAQ